MGKRERYELGTFCWADLATTNSPGAEAFYGELVGWEAEDMPAGEAGTYTMLRLGGTVFGGALDVMEAGHMAIIQDPAGAVLAAWQPERHIGARRVYDPGCMT